MSAPLVSGIILIVLLAGCTATQVERPTQGSSEPVARGPTLGGTVAPPALAAPPQGLNLTSCAGQMAMLPVPLDAVADDLPKAYQPRKITPASTTIIVRADACAQTAAGGNDLGPSKILTVLVPVTLVGVATQQSGEIPVFLFEAVANQADVASWIKNWTQAAGVGDLAMKFEGAPADYVAMSGSASKGNMNLYEWNGAAVSTRDRITERLRVYADPDPTKPSLLLTETYDRSMSDGPVDLVLHAGSVISTVLEGAPTAAGLSSIRYVATQTWQFDQP
jgi:hypothetical protein